MCAQLNACSRFIDGRRLNVLHMSLGFFVVFTAVDTIGNIEKSILDSVKDEDPSFSVNAYSALCIVYVVFAIGNWFCPSIIDYIGPRLAIVVSCVGYVAYIASFLSNAAWAIYLTSAFIGFGSSLMWTGEGTYLTLNSDENTITRNSGLFWTIYQSAMLFGNIYVYFAFEGDAKINRESRENFLYVMLGISIAGVVILCLLRPPKTAEGVQITRLSVGPVRALKDALALLKRREMQLLCVLFYYMGFFVSFSTAVYSPSVGATLNFGVGAKSLVGLAGCVLGAGEILGSFTMSLLGQRAEKRGRAPIICCGILIHLITYVAIFLNIPNSASFGDTYDDAYIKSNSMLAVICSGTMGYGVSLISNQIYANLGTSFADNVSAAFSIFYFCLSSGSAVSFVYSSYLGLHVQIIILMVTGLVGLLAFTIGETLTVKSHKTFSTQELANEDKSARISFSFENPKYVLDGNSR